MDSKANSPGTRTIYPFFRLKTPDPTIVASTWNSTRGTARGREIPANQKNSSPSIPPPACPQKYSSSRKPKSMMAAS